LVFHEGDKRRNHYGQPFKEKRRYLIAKGFASPRGQHDQGILLVQQMNDNLFLEGPESVIAENALEDGLRLTDLNAHIVF